MSEVLPGDLMQARFDIRTWDDEWHRGDTGPWIYKGEVGIALHVKAYRNDSHDTEWAYSPTVKVWLLINGRVSIVQSRYASLAKAWHVTRWAPQSGSL